MNEGDANAKAKNNTRYKGALYVIVANKEEKAVKEICHPFRCRPGLERVRFRKVPRVPCDLWLR